MQKLKNNEPQPIFKCSCKKKACIFENYMNPHDNIKVVHKIFIFASLILFSHKEK